ncbi:MAG TPA: MauE/DoxX family redox-associated membrane protein [Candidatus Babeliales bacterium]|nr:MauE/DoxX family redox-associated membrane protein [Candidatus Babeliales bacterium]
MNHTPQNHTDHTANQYTLKNFLPLIIIISSIILFTVAKQLFYGFDVNNAMLDCMAGFFIIFSLFKISNLRKFADAYSMYDIIAQRSRAYAYLYPFIELSLGISYLFHFQLPLINWITLFLMTINSIGVIRALTQNNPITCACLGAVFKIPMTYVTLAEDSIMAIMALVWLARYYQL